MPSRKNRNTAYPVMSRQDYEMALDSLRRKVYNPPLPGIGEGDDIPAVTKEEFRAAARLITGEEMGDDEDQQLSADLEERKVLDTESRIINLATLPEFQGYVMEILAQNDESLLDKDTFQNGWEDYQSRLQTVMKEMPQKIREYPFFSDNGICRTIAGKGDDDPDDPWEEDDPASGIEDQIIRLKEEDSFENDGMDEPQIKDPLEIWGLEIVGNAKQLYENARDAMITEVKNFISKKTGDVGAFAYTDQFDAANLIIANMIKDPYTGNNFIGEDAGFYTMGKGFDTASLNKKIDQLRTQIITDPAFKKVMATSVLPQDLFKRYKKEVRAEVERRNFRQMSRETRYLLNRQEAKALGEVAKKTIVTLPQDVQQQIKESYVTLVRVNKGKEPSDEMQKLMTALKAVQGCKSLSFQDLETLNNAALEYHTARKGVIFEPFTEKGKLRLQSVENLIRKTDNALEQPRKVLDKQVREGLKNIGKVNEQPKL